MLFINCYLLLIIDYQHIFFSIFLQPISVALKVCEKCKKIETQYFPNIFIKTWLKYITLQILKI